MFKYRYILKAWIFFFLRDVDPTFPTTPPGLQFLRKLGPNFQNTGLQIEPRFPAKPLRRKSVPNLGRSWGESSLQPFGCKLVRLQLGQNQAATTAIHLHLLHGHRPRSRPDRSQNPKSKLQTGRLDFGFWNLDFPACQVRVVRFYVSLFFSFFFFFSSSLSSPPSSFSSINWDPLCSVWRAGPQWQLGSSQFSVACRTPNATGILSVQCGVLDPNRDPVSSVWRPGPQPRSCEFSVAAWTPTAIL